MTNESPDRTFAMEGLTLVGLVATFLLRYTGFVASGLLFGPFLDNVHIYGPIFAEVSRFALTGAVPYYLPDIGTGFPVFESPHFSILYPFYFFGFLNYGGPVASLYTLTYLTLFHVFIFYVNLYVLLRCASIPPWAAYLGASVGLLARNTELYASWITISSSYAWLPLVLAGAVLLLRFPGKARGIFVFSIAAGLLALASPSQSVIHAMLSCLVLFAAGIAWLCLQRRFTEIRHLAWSLLLSLVIIFGLAGAATLPMYIATGEMIRHVGARATVIGHAHIPWKSFNLTQLRLGQAAGIVLRPAWISIVGSPYIGSLGAIGVILTGIYYRRVHGFLRVLMIAFGALALYGILSGFGTNLGLAYLNFHVPFINRIREAGRHLILFVIGVSFLSGLGFSLLVQSLENYKNHLNLRLLVTPAICFVVFDAVITWELVQDSRHRGANAFWILALAPILFVVGRLCRIPGYRYVVLSAFIVSIAAMVIPVRGYSVAQSDFAKPTNLLSHTILQGMRSRMDTVNYRVDFRDTVFDNKFWAMNASYYDVKSMFNQLTPQPYGQFRVMTTINIPYFRPMMGARYVLCGPNSSIVDTDAKQIWDSENYRLYENPNAMGRLTLLHKVGELRKQDDFLTKIRKGFDYFSEAYLHHEDFERAQKVLASLRKDPNTAVDRIGQVIDEPNRSYSTVESDSASLLVLNEYFTPAWKARVNGKKQPVLRVNEWQTGVFVSAGKNRVEFEYRPTLFRALMILNRVTMLVLVLLAIATAYRKAQVRFRGRRSAYVF